VNLLAYASKVARLIGDGLYGVDVKMTDKCAVLVEVNYNPNIDVGIKDGVRDDGLDGLCCATWCAASNAREETTRATVFAIPGKTAR